MISQKLKVNTFQDIVRILRERPEWLEEMRKLILTDELIALPKRFETFVEKEFKPVEGDVKNLKEDVKVLKEDVKVLKEDVKVLKEDVKVLKEDVKVLKEDVKVLKEDVKVLKEDVKVLKNDVAHLKGSDFERTIREKAPAYFGRIVKKCRVITFEELADTLEDAVEKNIITSEEKDDAILIDAVAKGILKKNNKGVILAVEASVKVDEEDVERAERRATVIGSAFNIPAIAIAIGREKTIEAEKKAESLDVIIL